MKPDYTNLLKAVSLSKSGKSFTQIKEIHGRPYSHVELAVRLGKKFRHVNVEKLLHQVAEGEDMQNIQAEYGMSDKTVQLLYSCVSSLITKARRQAVTELAQQKMPSKQIAGNLGMTLSAVNSIRDSLSTYTGISTHNYSHKELSDAVDEAGSIVIAAQRLGVSADTAEYAWRKLNPRKRVRDLPNYIPNVSTRVDVEKLRECFDQGMFANQAAKKLEISVNSAQAHYRKFRGNPESAIERFNRLRPEIQKYLEDGCPAPEIAETLSVGSSSIRRAFPEYSWTKKEAADFRSFLRKYQLKTLPYDISELLTFNRREKGL